MAFGLLAAWLLTAAEPVEHAHAQGAAERHGYALNWVRAPGADACISSTRLAERVEQLVGPVLRAPDASDRAIEGLVEPARTGNGFAVHFRIGDRTGAALGERSFASDAAACSELDDSIVLVLVLMIDPSASERGLPPELLGMLADDATPAADLLADLEHERAANARAEQVVVAAPAPEPVKPQPAATLHSAPDEAQVEPNSSLGVELAIAPALSAGIQPEIAPGLGLNARVTTRWVAFELAGSAWWPMDVPLDDGVVDGRQLELDTVSATLAACLPLAQAEEIRLSACAGAALVARWYASKLLHNPTDGSRTMLGPSASVDVRYALSNLVFVVASIGALAMLPKDTFFYTDNFGIKRSAYTPSLIGGSVSLGLGARL